MLTAGAGGELAELERLRTDEALLEERLAEARRQADAAVAAARLTAEDEAEHAASELAAELAARAAAFAAELDRLRSAGRETAQRRAADVRRLAGQGRKRALAMVVAALGGGEAAP